MDNDLELNLNLTHGVLNALNSSYQGGYVFFQVLEQLAPGSGAGDSAEKLKHPLDRINKWLADFRMHQPLFLAAERPGMNAEAAEAWRLLEGAKNRLGRLGQALKASSNVEQLLADRQALYARVAVLCESAYSRQHFIHGLVDYGEVMGREEVADRWRQQLLGCQHELAKAHYWLEQAVAAPHPTDPTLAADILNETLIFPTVIAQKITDMDSIIGYYRESFAFTDAGIPASLAPDWETRGFNPYRAGLWYRSGFDAETAEQWQKFGFEPIAAMHFLLRGFDLAGALPWWSLAIGGYDAAAWRNGGFTPEQAKGYINQGARRPEQIADLEVI